MSPFSVVVTKFSALENGYVPFIRACSSAWAAH